MMPWVGLVWVRQFVEVDLIGDSCGFDFADGFTFVGWVLWFTSCACFLGLFWTFRNSWVFGVIY